MTFNAAPKAVLIARKLTDPERGLKVCTAYLLGTTSKKKPLFSGRYFHEGWSSRNGFNKIVRKDLDSLKHLSVGRNIIKDGPQLKLLQRCNELLTKIPRSWAIEKMPNYLAHQNKVCTCYLGSASCGWEICELLWKEMATVNQFGSLVVKSKLLARKRSNLFPIYDEKIAKRLEIGTRTKLNYSLWGTFQTVMKDATVLKNLNKIKKDLKKKSKNKVVAELTLLRILDICLWMD